MVTLSMRAIHATVEMADDVALATVNVCVDNVFQEAG